MNADVSILSYISPFVFTQHLLPILKETAREPGSDVRIVNVGIPIILHAQDAKQISLYTPSQVTSHGHRLVPSGTRFKNLDDFNRAYATAWFPNFARYSAIHPSMKQ